MASDPLADDLAAKGVAGYGAGDPLADDLAAKGAPGYSRGGLTPERKAQLEAKHLGYQADIAGLRAERDAPDNNYVAAGVRGLSAGLSDVADAATLGGYRKLRNKALTAIDPGTLAAVTKAEDDYHAPIQGNPLMRAAQMGTGALGQGVGLSVGLGGLAGKAGGAIAKAAGGKIAAQAVGGAVGGGLTAGAQATIDGADPKSALRQAGMGALMGGGIGAAAGGVGKFLAGAPARAAESEMAGLTEGVTHRTALRKYLPNQDNIRAELGTEPQIRRAIKSDARGALPQVKAKLSAVAENELNPFYDQMRAGGHDAIPVQYAVDNLNAAKASLNKYAEGGHIAVFDHLIDQLQTDAAGSGGKLPADLLRQTATRFQSQGHANLPLRGDIPLTKEVKQGIGSALRGAVADHLESLTPNTASGKALRQAFTDANRKVATWYGIHDIVEEKARNEAARTMPMADLLKKGLHAASHPLMAALPFIEPGAEAINARILAPGVTSRAGQALAPAARAVGQAAPSVGVGTLQRMAIDKRRRDADAANNLLAGGGQ